MAHTKNLPHIQGPPPPSSLTSLGHPGWFFLAGSGWQSSGWAQAPLPSNAATQAAPPRNRRRAGPGYPPVALQDNTLWWRHSVPHFPGQGAGAVAYVQSWLKEKQLSAASTRPGGASAASASIGGSTRKAAPLSGGQPPQQPARAGSVGRLAASVPPRLAPRQATPTQGPLSLAPRKTPPSHDSHLAPPHPTSPYPSELLAPS